MRVALFTPVGLGSPVAAASALVAAELRGRGHVVDVVATETAEPAPERRRAPLVEAVSWREEAAVALLARQADLVLYQLGAAIPDHEGTIHWIGRVGGHLVLHDALLASRVLAGEETAPPSPRVDGLIAAADGVIVHSEHARGLVAPHARGSVHVAALPHEMGRRSEPLGSGRAPAAEAGVDGRAIRILTIGHVDADQLVEAVVHALAARPAFRHAFRYRIAGRIAPSQRGYLEQLAEDLGVGLELPAEVPEEGLAAEVAEADFCLALLPPTSETASAATIGAMLAGRPLAVLDGGFYADLPRDIVVHLDPEAPQEGLVRLFGAIRAGRIDLAELGARTRACAEATFRADAYVDLLERIPGEFDRGLLREIEEEYADLRDWPGRGPDSPATIFRDDIAIFLP